VLVVTSVKRYIRRVQFTGRSSFSVTLPKSWVLLHGLRERDQVVIEEAGSSLIIKPLKVAEATSRERAIVLERAESPESTARRVIAAYVMGFGKITVRGAIDAPTRNAIREVVLRKLPGVEIISESDSEVTLQVLLDPTSIPLASAAERLAKAASYMLRDACTLLSRVDSTLAREIVSEDDGVDRAYFYIIRLINYMAMGLCEIQRGLSLVDLLAYRSVSKLIERIGDHAANIARYAIELSRAGAEFAEASKMCTVAHSLFERGVSAFFSRNPLVVDEVAEEVEALRAQERSLLEKASSTLTTRDFVALKMILESIRRVAEYSKDIAEIALDLAISSLAAK
jgi:phosphate uptake regulator